MKRGILLFALVALGCHLAAWFAFPRAAAIVQADPGFIDQMMRMFHLRRITPHVSQEVDDMVTAVGLVGLMFPLAWVLHVNYGFIHTAVLKMAADGKL